MSIKCSQCHLINFADASACARCEADLGELVRSNEPKRRMFRWLLVRAGVIAVVCLMITLGFYLSLISSAKRLTLEQKDTVARGIEVLENTGFATEAMLLARFTAFRSTDHWLNAAVAKENAYAATNFPFMIMTLYSDFFTYPVDDVERAAILLHEARHLRGEGEKEAYGFVWRNRARLGWTKQNYEFSPVWLNIRQQTREYAPELFSCLDKDFAECE